MSEAEDIRALSTQAVSACVFSLDVTLKVMASSKDADFKIRTLSTIGNNCAQYALAFRELIEVYNDPTTN